MQTRGLLWRRLGVWVQAHLEQDRARLWASTSEAVLECPGRPGQNSGLVQDTWVFHDQPPLGLQGSGYVRKTLATSWWLLLHPHWNSTFLPGSSSRPIVWHGKVSRRVWAIILCCDYHSYSEMSPTALFEAQSSACGAILKVFKKSGFGDISELHITKQKRWFRNLQRTLSRSSLWRKVPSVPPDPPVPP